MINQEKVIENKTCKNCYCSFEIIDKDLEFYEKVSPVFAGKKYNIPTPKLCPDCRQKRRQSVINERNIYKRPSSFSGKPILSMFSPDKKYIVYSQDEWWSDNWDSKNYGKDFDFNRSFFEQYDELFSQVPLASLNSGYFNMVNSEYNNAAGDLKNCYLTFQSDYNEDCYYSYGIAHCKNVIDIYGGFELENCYGCVDCKKSYKLFFSKDCSDCSESYYLYNCNGCKNCYNCTNLNNKSYYIENKEYSKEEFFERIKEFQFNKMLPRNDIYPVKENNSLECENSTGNYIYNSKNCYKCFDCIQCKDCKYCDGLQLQSNSCYDISQFGGNTELCYESAIVGKNSYQNLFSIMLYLGASNVIYSYFCGSNCSNCFGCVSLRNSKYCILNKQYTKEEYEILVPKIIEHMISTGEWGEFFPSSISPFGYNETVANEYFKLSREEAISKGFKWSDYKPPFPKVEKIIKAEMLPENISDIPDDILNWAIECEITKKPFRIIKQELEFYRKHNLTIPRRHPDQRHLDRMSLRNPRKLFDRKCDKCGIDMKTTYSPDRKEIVYCEECYNKEVY